MRQHLLLDTEVLFGSGFKASSFGLYLSICLSNYLSVYIHPYIHTYNMLFEDYIRC